MPAQSAYVLVDGQSDVLPTLPVPAAIAMAGPRLTRDCVSDSRRRFVPFILVRPIVLLFSTLCLVCLTWFDYRIFQSPALSGCASRVTSRSMHRDSSASRADTEYGGRGKSEQWNEQSCNSRHGRDMWSPLPALTRLLLPEVWNGTSFLPLDWSSPNSENETPSQAHLALLSSSRSLNCVPNVKNPLEISLGQSFRRSQLVRLQEHARSCPTSAALKNVDRQRVMTACRLQRSQRDYGIFSSSILAWPQNMLLQGQSSCSHRGTSLLTCFTDISDRHVHKRATPAGSKIAGSCDYAILSV